MRRYACGGLGTCDPQPERGNICEPKSRESAFTGSLPSVVVVPKTERDTIQHGDVHDYMRCIKPIGEILFMFDSPRVSTGMCGGDKSCTRTARPAAPPKRIGAEGSVKLIKIRTIGTSKTYHSNAEQAWHYNLEMLLYYAIREGLGNAICGRTVPLQSCPFKANEVVRVEPTRTLNVEH